MSFHIRRSAQDDASVNYQYIMGLPLVKQLMDENDALKRENDRMKNLLFSSMETQLLFKAQENAKVSSSFPPTYIKKEPVTKYETTHKNKEKEKEEPVTKVQVTKEKKDEKKDKKDERSVIIVVSEEDVEDNDSVSIESVITVPVTMEIKSVRTMDVPVKKTEVQSAVPVEEEENEIEEVQSEEAKSAVQSVAEQSVAEEEEQSVAAESEVAESVAEEEDQSAAVQSVAAESVAVQSVAEEEDQSVAVQSVAVQSVAAEEEVEEGEVEEIILNGKSYFTSGLSDGSIVYACIGDDDVGDQVGTLVNGALVPLKK